MPYVVMLAYALAVGLTLSGFAGTAMELKWGRRLGFGPPFVMRERMARSLVIAFAVGPFMLTNEAMAARQAGAIDRKAVFFCMLGAVIWSIAIGVMVLELAFLVAGPIG